jgi:hypothetical protein
MGTPIIEDNRIVVVANLVADASSPPATIATARSANPAAAEKDYRAEDAARFSPASSTDR